MDKAYELRKLRRFITAVKVGLTKIDPAYYIQETMGWDDLTMSEMSRRIDEMLGELELKNT